MSMRIVPEPTGFLWDPGNFDKNLIKHGVTRQEAEELFTHQPFTFSPDTGHSTSREQRFQALGQTSSGRTLFVAYTVRNNKIRVISVRDMSKREEQAYAQLETDS